MAPKGQQVKELTLSDRKAVYAACLNFLENGKLKQGCFVSVGESLGFGERRASAAWHGNMEVHLINAMGAEADAYITVDRKGAARTAGGICVLPRDLLRFGELVRNRGFANGRQVIPEWWIEDCSEAGSRVMSESTSSRASTSAADRTGLSNTGP